MRLDIRGPLCALLLVGECDGTILTRATILLWEIFYMKPGSYSRKMNFRSFLVNKFVAHLYTGSFEIGAGCGATALSLITGDDPLSIKNRKDWKSSYLVSYLRKRGFSVASLTERNLTNFGYVEHPIKGSHVVLMRIKLIRKEASWVVLHNYNCYHNFETTLMRPYDMLDHPILEAFLVSHPSWFLKE